MATKKTTTKKSKPITKTPIEPTNPQEPIAEIIQELPQPPQELTENLPPAPDEPIIQSQPKQYLSMLEATVVILTNSQQPLTCKEIIEQAVATGIYKLGKGKTPANTLSSAINKEIKIKGNKSRFATSQRGKYRINA